MSQLHDITEELFLERVEEYGEVIDHELIRVLGVGDQVPNLHDGMMYSMGLDVTDRKIRGKRVRPALCMLTAESLGVERERPLAFACAIELLHNFALVHDDIEDGDSMRRGRPCTYRKYGMAHGINIGDYMLAKVFDLVQRDPAQSLPVREQLMELLLETLEELFAGQSLDISARASRTFTMKDYERLVAKKTGSYLSAPMIGGALMAPAGEDTIAALRRFGNFIGPMFQVKDDLIDLTSDKGRGEVGNDIREGKRSYLVASLTEVCSESEREELYDILDQPRDETSSQDVAHVLELFRKHRIIERGEEHCESLRRQGMEALAGLPQPLRKVLETAAAVLAKRTS